AEDVLLKALATKDMVGTRLNLALLYAWLGHINSGAKSNTYYTSAFTHVNAAVAMQGGRPFGAGQLALTDVMLALFHTMMGNHVAAGPYLEKSKGAIYSSTLSPVMVAMVYAASGDHHRAIDLLNRAASWHDRRLMYVNINPFFDNLHGEPGFTGLLKSMNL